MNEWIVYCDRDTHSWWWIHKHLYTIYMKRLPHNTISFCFSSSFFCFVLNVLVRLILQTVKWCDVYLTWYYVPARLQCSIRFLLSVHRRFNAEPFICYHYHLNKLPTLCTCIASEISHFEYLKNKRKKKECQNSVFIRIAQGKKISIDTHTLETHFLLLFIYLKVVRCWRNIYLFANRESYVSRYLVYNKQWTRWMNKRKNIV